VLGSKIVAIFATLHNYKIPYHLLSIFKEELGETRKQCKKMKNKNA